MKSLFFTACFILLMVTFTSCQKGETEKTNFVTTSIIGSWELRAIQGGMLPGRELERGNGTILQFSATHYTKYNSDTVVQSGTYAVVEDSTVSEKVGLVLPPGKFRYRIVFQSNINTGSTFIDIEGDKLSMVSGYFPLDYGLLQHYKKIVTEH